MNFIIDIQVSEDQTESELPDNKTIKSWVSQALEKFRKSAEVSLRIVDNKEIQILNKRYRHKDKPTNVLAFPAELPVDIGLEHELLGDVVIASSVVQQEAQEQNKTYQAHFAHMVIHGILHLLGFDHKDKSEAAIMEQQEIDLLHKLNFTNPYQHQ